jgi:hypothetical protein
MGLGEFSKNRMIHCHADGEVIAKMSESRRVPSYKEEFEQNGYVILRNLFTREEVRTMKEEAAAILQKFGWHDRSGVYLGMAKNSDVFKQAAQAPGLVPALKEIIGDYVIFMNDKLVLKDAATDFGSPWHQDYPYWFGSNKYSVWIALDKATKENGCLRVLPGSHKFGSMDHRNVEDSDHGFVYRLREEDIDPSAVVDFEAEAGDALIFHDLLYHASYPNTSGSDRWALISTYKDGHQPDPEYSWMQAPFVLP